MFDLKVSKKGEMAKNKLQEIFQKKSESLPFYLSQRRGGADHEPLWVSTVTLASGVSFQGEVKVTKVLAESSAAEKALEAQLGKLNLGTSTLSSPSSPSTFYSPSTSSSSTQSFSNGEKEKIDLGDLKVAILIDYENIPNLDFINSYESENVYCYVFLNKSHPKSDNDFSHLATKIICPTPCKDGTDSCIQLCIGAFLHDETFDCYILVTRDHFAVPVVEMIRCSSLLWRKRKAEIATTTKQIIQTLKDFAKTQKDNKSPLPKDKKVTTPLFGDFYCEIMGCFDQATFGNPDKIPTRCNSHHEPKMIVMNPLRSTYVQCNDSLCISIAHYGIDSPIKCRAHKEDGMSLMDP